MNYDYIYDYENRLIEVKQGRTTLSAYTYDPLGRRVTKDAGGETKRFIHDGDQILHTYSCNPGCTLDQSFIYSDRIDEPLRLSMGNTRYYYHHDALGNTTAITDIDGGLVENYQYGPYGNPHIFDEEGIEITSSSISNPYLFTGREYEEDTGLYYYRARYYSASQGRFLQRDPLTWGPDDPRIPIAHGRDREMLALGSTYFFGNRTDISSPMSAQVRENILRTAGTFTRLQIPYLYVKNGPVNLVDPYGLDWLSNLSNGSAGFGDTISFGATKWVRRKMGTDSLVNSCSVSYSVGKVGGYATLAVLFRTRLRFPRLAGTGKSDVIMRWFRGYKTRFDITKPYPHKIPHVHWWTRR